MNYGLKQTFIAVEEYIFGASPMPFIPYNETGNWEKWLPKYEPQAENFETNGCTVWGTQNQIETFYSFLYNYEPNYSERFTYLRVPVSPTSGADPQKVYETIREDGLVKEKYMPMKKDKDDFLDMSEFNGSLLAKGQYWLQKHEFKHEWLWNGRPENWLEVLEDGLKTSPIAVSVSAWTRRGDEYIDNGKRNNHWCLAYKIEDGHVWVFDTYDHSKKKLSKTHYIHRAKRIWLNRNTLRDLRRHKSMLETILNTLRMKKTLLSVVKEALGTDASPMDEAPDMLACVDTVTTLLRKVYPDVPHEVSTIRFNEWLSKSPNYRRVSIHDMKPENIIISPTEGTRVGHCGIVTDRGLIASNTSFGVNAGRILENYTLDSWLERYEKKLKLPVYVYERV